MPFDYISATVAQFLNHLEPFGGADHTRLNFPDKVIVGRDDDHLFISSQSEAGIFGGIRLFVP